MTSLKEELDRVEVGDPLHHRNLTLFPLLGPTATDMDYLLLEDAIQQGLARSLSEKYCAITAGSRTLA